MLVNTIASMVLISIHPFAVRKLVLVIAALLGFSALCFADPLLMTARYAPRPRHVDSAASATSQTTVPDPTGHFTPARLERLSGTACVMRPAGVI